MSGRASRQFLLWLAAFEHVIGFDFELPHDPTDSFEESITERSLNRPAKIGDAFVPITRIDKICG